MNTTESKTFSLFRKVYFFIILFLFPLFFSSYAQQNRIFPFSTDSNHITMWNGTEYIPVFIKGVNLGVSVPGTFPGELAATEKNYHHWFLQIKEAGFNCIRLYTLHYPRFYDALDSFNRQHPKNPLLFFQGVWLNEEHPGYENNLFVMTDIFKNEIEENIDCVHGNRSIPHRFGKAYGNYRTDVSEWCIAYIIGREIYPEEILTSNLLNPGIDSYKGKHFSIYQSSASEAWITSMLDHCVFYEDSSYNTRRPVSNSSWPTLDPLEHPEEKHTDEDTVSIDLSKIIREDEHSDLFISYHAYPYYPDFVSLQSSYIPYYDVHGPNSYLGYLTELKSHYKDLPLIIAEYGVPSSWAIAHYATSGMNHGGFDEYEQGLNNIRLLHSIKNTGCGGGIQFAWIDEWFKRTWITDAVDYIAESRVLWHNIAAAEQNYGLVSFKRKAAKDTLMKYNAQTDSTYICADANYAFFEVEAGIKDPLDLPGEMWIAFDTYDENLGESLLPSGVAIPFRSEFVLHLNNYSATLFVTEAYDIFGIWHGFSEPHQLYRSVPSDGADWKIVRVRNNASHSDVQYIGDLQVNYAFQPLSSKDAVRIHDNKVHIRIPWSYLHVVAPNQMRVLHDRKNTVPTEDTLSDGFAVSIYYKNNWHYSPQRYTWNTWNTIVKDSLTEEFKNSYYIMKNQLHNFNTKAFAVRDSYYFPGPAFPVHVDSTEGLLRNDFDLDGNFMKSLIIENPLNGIVDLNNDGAFSYTPNEYFVGYDSFRYCIYDGHSLSEPNTVVVYVEKNVSVEAHILTNIEKKLKVYPNPAEKQIRIESKKPMQNIEVFDIQGKLLESILLNKNTCDLDVSLYQKGIYYIVAGINGDLQSLKFVKN
jgi:hypothetical protein